MTALESRQSDPEPAPAAPCGGHRASRTAVRRQARARRHRARMTDAAQSAAAAQRVRKRIRRGRGRGRAATAQTWQSTATARAAQISRIRASASRPSRSTRTPSETLSTESKLTAERCGTGSLPGSRTTSLGNARIVVVQGATSARRSRGMAASRDRTTTGRRPTSGNLHHHSSPRAGG